MGVKDVRHGAEGDLGFEKRGELPGFEPFKFAEENGKEKESWGSVVELF